MAVNPFKPTAGKMPPILIGRQSIIEDFSEALANGAGAPGRIMLITGQRGFGKTVMLTEFRRIARAQHWETIGETASEGLVSGWCRRSPRREYGSTKPQSARPSAYPVWPPQVRGRRISPLPIR